MGTSVKTMKWADLWVGVPLSYALTALRRIKKILTPLGKSRELTFRRVLCIELSEMGSMVAARQILVEFQRRHPGMEMYFLTFEQNRKCLDALDIMPRENVITIVTDSLPVFARSAIRAIRAMRTLHLDAVVDFELFSRVSAILSALAGAQRTAGFHRMHLEGLYRGDMHTHPVGYNHYVHISRNFGALVMALESGVLEAGALKQRVEIPSLPIERPAIDGSRRIAMWSQLRSLCPELTEASRLIVLNPNAGDLLPMRAWPLKSYAELTRRLVVDPSIVVLVTGTEEAAADAAVIARAVKSTRVIDLTARLQFDDLIPLYSLADMLITNDSGPAHFAALTDTAIFVFFGPETPDLYRPLSPKCHILYSKLHCSPCLNAYNHRTTSCTNNLCLQVISVDEVEKEVRDCLASEPVPGRPPSL